MRTQLQRTFAAALLCGAFGLTAPAYAQLGGGVGGTLGGSAGGALGGGGIGVGSGAGLGAGGGFDVGGAGSLGGGADIGAGGNLSGAANSAGVSGGADASAGANANVEPGVDLSGAVGTTTQAGAQAVGQATGAADATVNGAADAAGDAAVQTEADTEAAVTAGESISADALANLHGRTVVGANGETLGQIYGSDAATGMAFIQSAETGEGVGIPAASLSESANGSLMAEAITPADLSALAAAQSGAAANVQ